MKKLLNNRLFIFMLGVIISGSSVYAANLFANNVSYDNTNSGMNSNNVQGAIDELYTKIDNNNYEEYEGFTTYTPNSSIQTVPTNNKLMKSDITINAIPSSYKNLNTTTTVNSNNLLNGITAYNNNGDLITGNVNTDCVSGIYNKPANSQLNLYLGFNPSSYNISVYENNITFIYDYNKLVKRVYWYYVDNNVVNFGGKSSDIFASNNNLQSLFNTSTPNGLYSKNSAYYYVACK